MLRVIYLRLSTNMSASNEMIFEALGVGHQVSFSTTPGQARRGEEMICWKNRTPGKASVIYKGVYNEYLICPY